MAVAAPLQPAPVGESPPDVPCDALIEEARQRARRRRLLYLGSAAGLIALAASAFVFITGGTRPPRPAPATASQSDDGLPTASATPSSPPTGELVATVAQFSDSAWYLYADGRLISTGGGDWIERRLTPSGVERVRSAFVSTGLFDPGQPFTSVPLTRLAPFWCTCLREGDRLLSAGPVPENPFEAVESSRAVDRLIESLKQLVSSPNPDLWVDHRGKRFVASRFVFCVSRYVPGKTTQEALPDPADALALLPADAAARLGGLQPTGGGSEVLGDATCYEVAADDARALTAQFNGSGHQFDVTEPIPMTVSVLISPLLPDGSPALFPG